MRVKAMFLCTYTAMRVKAMILCTQSAMRVARNVERNRYRDTL